MSYPDMDPGDRPRLTNEVMNELIPFSNALDLELVSTTPRRVEGRLDWSREKCTAGDALHGGVLMAMADNFGGVCAYLNLPPGMTTSTIESKTNFFRAVREGRVESVSRPLHAGRSTVVVQTDLFDSEGRRVGQTTQTQAVIGGEGGGMNPRVYLLALGTFATGTVAFMVAGILPLVADEFGVSVGTAGQLMTLFSLTFGLGAPFLAALTGNLPRGRLLIWALSGLGPANLGAAFLSPTFATLGAWIVAAGVCVAFYSPTAFAASAALAPPEKQGRAMSVVSTGMSSATIVGVPLGSWIGQNAGWQGAFGLVAAVSGLGVAVMALVGLPEIPNPPKMGMRARLSPILRPKMLLGLSPTFFWSVGVFCVYAYVAPLLGEQAGVGSAGGLLLVWGAGGFVGNWLGGWATDRFGLLRPTSLFLLAQALVLAALPVAAASLPGASTTMLLWGIVAWAAWPAHQSRARALASEDAGVVLGLSQSVFQLGVAAGSVAGGIVLASFGVRELGFCGCAFTLLSFLLFLAGGLARKKKVPAAGALAGERSEGHPSVEAGRVPVRGDHAVGLLAGSRAEVPEEGPDLLGE